MQTQKSLELAAIHNDVNVLIFWTAIGTNEVELELLGGVDQLQVNTMAWSQRGHDLQHHRLQLN